MMNTLNDRLTTVAYFAYSWLQKQSFPANACIFIIYHQHAQQPKPRCTGPQFERLIRHHRQPAHRAHAAVGLAADADLSIGSG